MKRYRAGLAGIVAALTGTATLLAASGQPPVPIAERAQGAERVVVATVAQTTAQYERNEFGDRVIVTHARLAIEEAIKGDASPATLAVEGGTVDGMTLRVSSLPLVTTGDRAVFFLTPGPHGEFKAHLKGQGILPLDATNHVRGSSLTLANIRQMARPNGK